MEDPAGIDAAGGGAQGHLGGIAGLMDIQLAFQGRTAQLRAKRGLQAPLGHLHRRLDIFNRDQAVRQLSDGDVHAGVKRLEPAQVDGRRPVAAG